MSTTTPAAPTPSGGTPPPAGPTGSVLKSGTPARQRGVRGAWLVAVAALMVAIPAAALAVYAIGKAGQASEQAREARAQAESLAGETGEPDTPGDAQGNVPTTPAINEGDDQPAQSPTEASPDATPPDVLNPQATYTEKYADEVLNPQATEYNSAYVDLDEPRVGGDLSQADITLNLEFDNSVPYFSFGNDVVAARAPDTAELTPQDCRELIRTGPLPDGSEVPAQRGLVLCVATSPEGAAAQGITQKIVVLHVTALADGARATVHLDAWEIPG